MDIDRYYNLIKDKYTFPSNLKPQQKDFISRIMLRQNVISVWPTGFGKSLAYLVPPLILDEIE